MFRFGLDKKTMILLVFVTLLMGALARGMAGILDLLFAIPGVLIALTFHEFAHGYVAYKLGDDTPKIQGRLNLNPLTHIDPMGFAFLVAAGFGWGKPIEINSRNFNGKYSVSKAEAIVAAAGPIMNFIVAFVILLIIEIVLKVANITILSLGSWQGVLVQMAITAASINIGLGIFNLIPLPPLDGSKILMHFLPYNKKQWFYEKEQILYLIFLLMVITGFAKMFINPIFEIVIQGMIWCTSNIVGIFM